MKTKPTKTRSLLLLGALLFTLSSYSQIQIGDISVQNGIKIGDLAGNRKLSFGVKNIIEEILLERGVSIVPSSKNQIFAEIVYMDILKTQSNMSIFHKDNTDVVIRIKGYVIVDGKKSKEIMAEGSASEVSTSTLLIGNDGKLNQQNLSTAIKKTCYELLEKLPF